MSYFKGTFEEFYKIINPLTRNLVANMSRKAKQHTTCSTPGCNKRTSLEAAHLAGKSRPTITADIVRKMIGKKDLDNGIIEIDLDVFLQKFVEEHTPLEKSIKILCKECHKKYDKENNVEFNDVINIDNIEDEATDEDFKEAVLSTMKKEDIRALVAKEVKDFSFSDSCFFANVNKTKAVWWVEPNKDKFNNSWLLLNNTEKKEVHLFKMDSKLSTEKLKTRKDKNNQYKLEILTENAPNSFKDRFSGVDFKEFYVQTVKY